MCKLSANLPFTRGQRTDTQLFYMEVCKSIGDPVILDGLRARECIHQVRVKNKRTAPLPICRT